MNVINNSKKYQHIILLSMIAMLSFALNFCAIAKIGYGNAYYAAAIKSMSQNFHNFFYVSFDPAGIVSVDKPPLALWVQTLFVKILGYHGWTLLLPQALAGTGSCIMLYILTARYYGRKAGLLSSLIMALTPAVVVVSRNNTMDMQLILCLLTATWFLFRAIEKRKTYLIFLAAFMIGLGFNIKMLQAYLILPAVGIVYFVFSREKRYKRILHSFISLLIIIVVSLAWVVTVDSTPSSSRPYVGSSTNNTVTELIIGHNGLERLLGSTGLMQKKSSETKVMNKTIFNPTGNPIDGNHLSAYPNKRINRQSSGIAGNNIGYTGLFRLWRKSLFGQISWFILLSLFCIASKCQKKSSGKNLKISHAVFTYWIIWLMTMYMFFSFAQFWHRYYLCMFAPAIAGIVGPGLVSMFRYARNKHRIKRFLLPSALIATMIPELLFVWNYKEVRNWLGPIMLIFFCISLILMILSYNSVSNSLLKYAMITMLISLFAAPLYWCVTVMMYPSQNSTMPYAGPELADTRAIEGMTPNQENLIKGDAKTKALENYLVAHYKEGSYLVVSQRANDVAEFIVDTGLPAVSYGGFSGMDAAITVDKLKQLVKDGKVTYFMVTDQMLGFGTSSLISYVKDHSVLINPSEYSVNSSNITNSFNFEENNKVSLYLFGPSSQ